MGGKVYSWNTLRNPTDTHWSTDRWVRGSFSVLQQLEEMALRANVRKCGEIVILFKQMDTVDTEISWDVRIQCQAMMSPKPRLEV